MGRLSTTECTYLPTYLEETVHTIHRTLLTGWPCKMPCVRRCGDAADDASAKPLHQNSNGCGRHRWPNVGSTWCPSSRPLG